MVRYAGAVCYIPLTGKFWQVLASMCVCVCVCYIPLTGKFW